MTADLIAYSWRWLASHIASFKRSEGWKPKTGGRVSLRDSLSEVVTTFCWRSPTTLVHFRSTSTASKGSSGPAGGTSGVVRRTTQQSAPISNWNVTNKRRPPSAPPRPLAARTRLELLTLQPIVMHGFARPPLATYKESRVILACCNLSNYVRLCEFSFSH